LYGKVIDNDFINVNLNFMAGANSLVVHMANVQSQKVIAFVHRISLKKRLGKINSAEL